MSNIMNKEPALKIYQRFWKDFAKYLKVEGSNLGIDKPSLDGHQRIKKFCTGVFLELTITSQKKQTE